MSAQLIESVPTYDLAELDGKTLTISVGQDYNIERDFKFTIVVGTDENGYSYVLVDRKERLRDVQPIER